MTTDQLTETRRGIIAATMVGALAGLPTATDAAERAPTGHIDDFDFLIGAWRVRHHQLVGRLVGSTTWRDFDGTCVAQKILGGQGNLDDNVLHIPSGTYQGASLRLFDPEKKIWSIFWIDSRSSKVEPPVAGGFDGAHGVFFGDDQWDGRPVRVRFQWSVESADRARWEQAFSGDVGLTWETNWVMHFERTA